MKLDCLIPTHNELRDQKSVRSFVSFLKEGRIYRGQDKPIAINKFEDGKLYVRDGHHRVCAAIIVGIDSLLDCEYEVEEFKYADYMCENLRNGFLTPFDPRTQCRLSNFFDFKNQATQLLEDANRFMDFPIRADHSEVHNFISNNHAKYREARRVKSFVELVKQCRF